MASANLELIIGVVDKSSGPLGKITGAVGGLGKLLGGAALGGAAVAIGGISAALIGGIGDAREAGLVFAQTEAVIKSTGGAAGFTAEQISDMAASYSLAEGKSLFGDDDIQKGQNLLLTFTNIKETLPEATGVMVDMATAMGTDVSGGAIQLGKALNDPIKGISALSRVGVTFTEEQKNQIKVMQESGNMAGAQGIILAELNKEFGGSAEAAAAAAGPMIMFKERMGELAESVGAQVLPLLDRFGAWLSSPEIMGAIETGIGAAITFLTGTLLPALTNGFTFLTTNILPLLSSGFTLISTAITTQIIPAFTTISTFVTTTLLPPLQQIVTWARDNATPVLIGLAAAVTTILIPMFVAWVAATWTSVAAHTALAIATAAAYLPIIAIAAAVGLAVAGLYLAWNNNVFGMRDTLTAFWNDHVSPIFNTVKTWLETNIPVAIGALQSAWSTAWPIIQGAVQTVYNWLSGTVWPWFQNTLFPLMKSMMDDVKLGWGVAWPAIQQAVKVLYDWLLGTVWPWFRDTLFPLMKSLMEDVKAGWEVAWPAIQTAVDTVYTFFKDTVLPGIQGFLTDLKTGVDTLQAGWDTAFALMKGYVDGVKSAWDTLASGISAAVGLISGYIETLKGIFRGIKDSIPDVLLPGSPTPFELGLRGIGKAARDIVPDLQRMGSALSSLNNPMQTLLNNPTGNNLLNNPAGVFAPITWLGDAWNSILNKPNQLLDNLLDAVPVVQRRLNNLNDTSGRLNNLLQNIRLTNLNDGLATAGGRLNNLLNGAARLTNLLDATPVPRLNNLPNTGATIGSFPGTISTNPSTTTIYQTINTTQQVNPVAELAHLRAQLGR